MFRVDMSLEEMAAALEVRFTALSTPRNNAVSAATPTRGQPVKIEDAPIFERIDSLRMQGKTARDATEVAVVESEPHRDRYGDYILNKVDTTQRTHRRHRKRAKDGLDPNRSYDENIFFECIMNKQWQTAAAIFVNANKLRRVRLCKTLNKRAS